MEKKQNLMTRITTLTGKPLDHSAKLMHWTRQNLRDKNLRLQILDREAQTTSKVIGVLVKEIHMAIIKLYEINSIVWLCINCLKVVCLIIWSTTLH